jgi:tetratricopeptide (TPR) repeat protein
MNFKKIMLGGAVTCLAVGVFAAENFKTAFDAAMKNYRAKKYAAAIPELQEAEKLAKTPIEQYKALMHQGWAFDRSRKWADAAAAAKKVIAIKDLNPLYLSNAYSTLSVNLYRTQKYKEAIALADEVADNPKITTRLSCIYYAYHSLRRLREYDKSLEYAKKYMAVSKPDSNNFFRGKLMEQESLYSLKKYEECLKAVSDEQFAKMSKQYQAETYNWRALALIGQKKYKEAKELFAKAATLTKSDYWKGLSLLRQAGVQKHNLKDYDGALVVYTAVCEVPGASPTHKGEAYYRMAELLNSKGKVDAAMVEIVKIEAQKRPSGYWLGRSKWYKGILLLKQGKKEEAKKEFEAAMKVKGCASWIKKSCQKELAKLNKK